MRHRESVLAAEFSPDVRRVATGSLDHTVRVWDTASGRSLTEPLPTGGRPYGLQWSANGRRLFAKCDGGPNLLWQLPELTTPAPSWLAEWAEAIGGQRLDESGTLIDVGFEEYRRFRDRVASLAGSDVYGEALRWFFATGPERPIAPGSRVTAKDQSEGVP